MQDIMKYYLTTDKVKRLNGEKLKEIMRYLDSHYQFKDILIINIDTEMILAERLTKHCLWHITPFGERDILKHTC